MEENSGVEIERIEKQEERKIKIERAKNKVYKELYESNVKNKKNDYIYDIKEDEFEDKIILTFIVEIETPEGEKIKIAKCYNEDGDFIAAIYPNGGKEFQLTNIEEYEKMENDSIIMAEDFKDDDKMKKKIEEIEEGIREEDKELEEMLKTLGVDESNISKYTYLKEQEEKQDDKKKIVDEVDVQEVLEISGAQNIGENRNLIDEMASKTLIVCIVNGRKEVLEKTIDENGKIQYKETPYRTKETNISTMEEMQENGKVLNQKRGFEIEINETESINVFEDEGKYRAHLMREEDGERVSIELETDKIRPYNEKAVENYNKENEEIIAKAKAKENVPDSIGVTASSEMVNEMVSRILSGPVGEVYSRTDVRDAVEEALADPSNEDRELSEIARSVEEDFSQNLDQKVNAPDSM